MHPVCVLIYLTFVNQFSVKFEFEFLWFVYVLGRFMIGFDDHVDFHTAHVGQHYWLFSSIFTIPSLHPCVSSWSPPVAIFYGGPHGCWGCLVTCGWVEPCCIASNCVVILFSMTLTLDFGWSQSTTWFLRYMLQEYDDERWTSLFWMTKVSVFLTSLTTYVRTFTNKTHIIPVIVKLVCTLFKPTQGSSMILYSELFAIGK